MQYGTFITIPVLTVVAIAFRRYRAAAAMAASGIGVYLIARVVKAAVDRGRPDAMLADVHAREVFGEGSLGFPSGHAAVAAALAYTCAMYFGGWVLRISVALAIVVPLGRLYVGAHLPLDVIGGAALGVVAGSVAHMLIGMPRVTRPLAEAEQPLDDTERTDDASP
jgi:undecaprenyl-diphosphatase